MCKNVLACKETFLCCITNTNHIPFLTYPSRIHDLIESTLFFANNITNNPLDKYYLNFCF